MGVAPATANPGRGRRHHLAGVAVHLAPAGPAVAAVGSRAVLAAAARPGPDRGAGDAVPAVGTLAAVSEVPVGLPGVPGRSRRWGGAGGDRDDRIDRRAVVVVVADRGDERRADRHETLPGGMGPFLMLGQQVSRLGQGLGRPPGFPHRRHRLRHLCAGAHTRSRPARSRSNPGRSGSPAPSRTPSCPTCRPRTRECRTSRLSPVRRT